MEEPARIYPGDVASPEQIKLLALEYRDAALSLLARGRRGEPASWAPARLMAIHAIELYLNAYLLRGGLSAAQVRGMQHDLSRRSDHAATTGLKLRKRTEAHLRALNERREYLVSRYGPELAGTCSQLNRLAATLREVATKVEAEFQPPPRAIQPASSPAASPASSFASAASTSAAKRASPESRAGNS